MLVPVGTSSIFIALYKSGNACANLMHVAVSPAYSRDRGFDAMLSGDKIEVGYMRKYFHCDPGIGWRGIS
jgi:hypothetical protein